MSAGQLLQQAGLPVPAVFTAPDTPASDRSSFEDDNDVLHDLIEFCDYLEQRPKLSFNQQDNVRVVMVPALEAMVQHFTSMQQVADLPLLKLVGKWIGHLRNLLAKRKDMDASLLKRLEDARRRLKTQVSALCVGAMLKELTPARPLSEGTVARARAGGSAATLASWRC